MKGNEAGREIPFLYQVVKYSTLEKKGWRFSRPQPGCHLQNSLWPGIIKLFPARESLGPQPGWEFGK